MVEPGGSLINDAGPCLATPTNPPDDARPGTIQALFVVHAGHQLFYADRPAARALALIARSLFYALAGRR